MRRLAPVLLVLTGCASHHAQPPVSGPPTTDAPEVLALVVDRQPFHRPAPTTTAITAPPATTTTTRAAVVRKSQGNPVPARIEQATARTTGEDCGGWRDVVAAAFPGEVDYACRVFIGCESGGNPKAVSSTDDHGLAQINRPTWNRPGHHDPVADWIGRHWASVYDPATNLEMARRIRAAYGWGMWACA